MRFGPRAVDRATGAVLAHTLRLESGTLRKGTVLTGDAVEALAAAGIDEVTVAVLEEGDVGEDETAALLAEAARGPGLRLRGPFTGRCNLMARVAGLVRVDAARVDEANRVDEALTLATVPDWTRVDAGELVATAKVIPLGVASSFVEAATECLRQGAPVLRLLPFRPRRAGLVLTTLSGDAERLRERALRVTRRRLESLGSALEATRTVPHDVGAVADALETLRAKGCDLLLVLGASAVVDRADVVPAGVQRVGGRIHRLGIPVDPGNLLLLASFDDVPVVGVPGCARSSRRSGFDTVLERLAAGVAPSADELAVLGVGGLLREIPSRPQPRVPSDLPSEADDSERALGGGPAPGGEEAPRVAGLVLAAGSSQRMSHANKLLQEVNGSPMVLAVVRCLEESGLEPLVVVTGHEADEVETALEGSHARTVRNLRFEEGMGTSLAAGVAALDDTVDGVLVALADMPRVSVSTIRALLEAFRSVDVGTASVCVPVYRAKRGNPVLWSSSFLPELARLAGDVGGRTLLSEHAEAVREVIVDDPGVLMDVDTRDALDRLRQEGHGSPS